MKNIAFDVPTKRQSERVARKVLAELGTWTVDNYRGVIEATVPEFWTFHREAQHEHTLGCACDACEVTDTIDAPILSDIQGRFFRHPDVARILADSIRSAGIAARAGRSR